MSEGETVQLRDGRTMVVPEYAALDLMLEHLASGRPLGDVAGEGVLLWAEVLPAEDDGALVRQLVDESRRIVYGVER